MVVSLHLMSLMKRNTTKHIDLSLWLSFSDGCISWVASVSGLSKPASVDLGELNMDACESSWPSVRDY